LKLFAQHFSFSRACSAVSANSQPGSSSIFSFGAPQHSGGEFSEPAMVMVLIAIQSLVFIVLFIFTH